MNENSMSLEPIQPHSALFVTPEKITLIRLNGSLFDVVWQSKKTKNGCSQMLVNEMHLHAKMALSIEMNEIDKYWHQCENLRFGASQFSKSLHYSTHDSHDQFSESLFIFLTHLIEIIVKS